MEMFYDLQNLNSYSIIGYSLSHFLRRLFIKAINYLNYLAQKIWIYSTIAILNFRQTQFSPYSTFAKLNFHHTKFFTNKICLGKFWMGGQLRIQKSFDVVFVLFLFDDTCYIKWLIISLLDLSNLCLMDNLIKKYVKWLLLRDF